MNVLENTGIIKLNYDATSAPDINTICVIGLPRSGTSMVSSALFHLGVFIGDKAYPPTYEDKLLKDALDGKNYKKYVKQVKKYDRQHSLWAFKLPRATYRMKETLEPLRNPALIVTFRDPLSISIRKSISESGTNLFQSMQNSINKYKNLLNSLSDIECPILMLAYDKVLHNSRMFVEEVAALAGVKDEEKIATAVHLMEEDRSEYLDKARHNKAYGVVESVVGNRVTGWVIYQLPNGKEPPVIEVLLNGSVIEEQPVNTARPDLKHVDKRVLSELGIRLLYVRRNINQFGTMLGFDFRLPKNDDGIIALRVRGDFLPFWETDMKKVGIPNYSSPYRDFHKC